MFNFEKLEVWQKAIAFADAVYRLTRGFPSDERFGLTNQIRRAAISISSNIAEGSARSARRRFRKFLGLCQRVPLRSRHPSVRLRATQGFCDRAGISISIYAEAEEISPHAEWTAKFARRVTIVLRSLNSQLSTLN